jgi:ribose transport system permease protein
MSPKVQGRGWRVPVLPRFALDYLGLSLVLLLLIALFSVTTQHFFSAATFRMIANQIPDATIIAVGMTLVLIIGGIDLSVGSVLALSGAVLGVVLARWGWPLPLAIAAALGAGAACGMVNGGITARWPIPSFIVTLGMLEAARGGAYLLTNSSTQYLGASINVLTATTVLGISMPAFVALLTVILGQVLLSATALGRHMRALGANAESARLSGLATRRITLAVFTASGALAGLAAVVHAARLSAADPNAGTGYELQAIAAVVIGGTSLMGGRGSVVGSFLGVLILAVLEYGLIQLGAQDPVKRLMTGAVIVIAVILDYYRHRFYTRQSTSA